MSIAVEEKRAEKIMARRPFSRNILNVFNQATDDELVNGIRWYWDANEIAFSLSPHNVKMGAGVIAALSPMTSWNDNVNRAKRAFSQGYADRSLKHNCRKANAIMQGADPLDVLKGNKVRNFYMAILDPMSDAVVIDRHAFDVAVGRTTNDSTRRVLARSGAYERFQHAYVLAGSRIGAERLLEDGSSLSASQIQAVTWLTWRRIKHLP